MADQFVSLCFVASVRRLRHCSLGAPHVSSRRTLGSSKRDELPVRLRDGADSAPPPCLLGNALFSGPDSLSKRSFVESKTRQRAEKQILARRPQTRTAF